MLTPKAQKDFTDWALKQPYFKKGVPNIGIEETEPDLYLNGTLFKKLPIAAQFGIYQDYFWQEHKIFIEIIGKLIDTNLDSKIYMDLWIYKQPNDGDPLRSLFIKSAIKSMDEARKTAIQEASKLLEGRL